MSKREIQLKGNEKILIVRTDRIGDVVLSTPVAEVLKQRFPQGKIDFLVAPYTTPILKNNSFIDEIILDDNKSVKGFFKLRETLKQRKYNLAVVLHPTLRLAYLLKTARIPIRIGTGYRGYSFLFNQKIYQNRKTVEKHELEYNLDMLRPLEIESPKIVPDRKSTRLNSSHQLISYAVFCLQKEIDATRNILQKYPMIAALKGVIAEFSQ